MKKHPNITLGLLLALFVALGAIQGQRLDRLFEADAFYKWIVAAATNERFGWSEAVDHEDPALYKEVVAATDPLLSEAIVSPENQEAISTLSRRYSIGVRCTSKPARRTMRAWRSTSTSPKRNTGSASSGAAPSAAAARGRR